MGRLQFSVATRRRLWVLISTMWIGRLVHQISDRRQARMKWEHVSLSVAFVFVDQLPIFPQHACEFIFKLCREVFLYLQDSLMTCTSVWSRFRISRTEFRTKATIWFPRFCRTITEAWKRWRHNRLARSPGSPPFCHQYTGWKPGHVV